jgi:hypothetical protein
VISQKHSDLGSKNKVLLVLVANEGDLKNITLFASFSSPIESVQSNFKHFYFKTAVKIF